jgi:hypothetical protein
MAQCALLNSLSEEMCIMYVYEAYMYLIYSKKKEEKEAEVQSAECIRRFVRSGERTN